MNRKEFKLLMESWRSDFVHESLEEIHEENNLEEIEEIEENSIDEELGGYHIAEPFDIN
jgi:hypothetical protein